MRLFHFSEDPKIARFAPRPVQVPAQRPSGKEWLNGALVWAIDEAHQRLYLFPRECPRIVLWPKASTSDEDRLLWLKDMTKEFDAIAIVESSWVEAIQKSTLCRYELPHGSFEDIQEVGMWVSHQQVEPITMAILDDLESELASSRTKLCVVDSLLQFKPVWGSSVHASGIRLRNARGWGEPGWPHSPPTVR